MPEAKDAVKTTLDTRPEARDAALIATWRRFLDYDQVSSDQKRLYSRLKEYMIVLGLLTSAGAVFSIYLTRADELAWLNLPFFKSTVDSLSWILRILLIAMPIAIGLLMRYASQFASSTTWIEYRVGAETLRSEIYLYRMRAGEYQDLSDVEARRKLLKAIDAANARIDEQNATVPYMRNYDNIEQLITSKTESPGVDDGFTKLYVDDYIEWRVKKQLNWYIQKIQRDYSTSRREQILALVVGAFGALLSGIGRNLEALVAVTTAMGIALTARSETRMYGATYGIFHWTAGKLLHELNKWEILTNEQKQDVQNQLKFVEAIEKIFSQERELWRAQAVQSQNNADNTINNQLQKRIDRDELEAHQAAGLPLSGIPEDEVMDDYINYSTTQNMKVLKPADIQRLSEEMNQTNGTPGEVAKIADTAFVPEAQEKTTDSGTVVAETLIDIAEVQADKAPEEPVVNDGANGTAAEPAAEITAEATEETDDSKNAAG